MNAKWVWNNDSSHYFLNEKNSDEWKEFNKGRLILQYKFIKYDGENPIIFDNSKNMYGKILDDQALFDYNKLENLTKAKYIEKGHWEVAPLNRPKNSPKEAEKSG